MVHSCYLLQFLLLHRMQTPDKAKEEEGAGSEEIGREGTILSKLLDPSSLILLRDGKLRLPQPEVEDSSGEDKAGLGSQLLDSQLNLAESQMKLVEGNAVLACYLPYCS